MAALVAVPITAGVVVHHGHHAFREGDTLNLPPDHAAELHGHLARAKTRHEAAAGQAEAASAEAAAKAAEAEAATAEAAAKATAAA